MKNHNKLEKLQVILILVFITSFFLVSVIYMFLTDIPILISLFDRYFTSGNSFFFPFIPNISLLWFLPEKYQIINLTFGQLVDIFIIINIIIHIDSSVYHYVKNVCLNNDTRSFTFLDLYIRNNAELHRKSQKTGSSIESEDWSMGDIEYIYINTKKNGFLRKRISNLSNNHGKKESCVNIKWRNEFCLKTHNLSNFQQKFYYYSAFIISSFYGLKYHCLPPNTNTSPNLYESKTQEDTEMKKKCNFSEYKKVFLINSINN